MTRLVDILTAGVKRAADILFVINPKGSSIGVFFGILAHGVFRLLTPLFKSYRDIVDPTQVNIYYFIAGGVALANLPTLFRRRPLPPEVEDALAAVDRMRGKVSDAHLRLQYLAVCSRVVERVNLGSAGGGPTPTL